MVRIAVDEREKPSGVPDELRSKGASVEYRVLEVADYIVDEGFAGYWYHSLGNVAC